MTRMPLNDVTDKLDQSYGESPRVSPVDRKRVGPRSRWGVDTYILPQDGTQYLTLALALLSTFALFVGMLCTGLAVLNHYYGLRISISLTNWPATTLEIGGDINNGSMSGGNEPSINHEAPLEIRIDEHESKPEWLDKWPKRTQPITADHRQQSLYRPRYNTGDRSWSAQSAPLPPPSPDRDELPPWLAESSNGASFMRPVHRSGELSSSYVDDGDDVAAKRYNLAQLAGVDDEIPGRHSSSVGRDAHDDDKPESNIAGVRDAYKPMTNDDYIDEREVELERRRLIDSGPSVSDVFASDYQESLLNEEIDKQNIDRQTSSRATVIETVDDVTKATASGLRESKHGRKRLLLEQLLDSPDAKKLHRKRVLSDKSSVESRVDTAANRPSEDVFNRDVFDSLVIPKSLATVKLANVWNDSLTSSTVTSVWPESVGAKSTIIGASSNGSGNDSSGVSTWRWSNSTRPLIEQLYGNDEQGRRTGKDDAVNESVTDFATVMKSPTSGDLRISAHEIPPQQPTRSRQSPLGTTIDAVPRRSAETSVSLTDRIRPSRQFIVKDYGHQYSGNGKLLDRSLQRDQMPTEKKRAVWKRGRKFTRRHRERRQAASPSPTTISSSSMQLSGSVSTAAAAAIASPGHSDAQQGVEADKQRLMQLVAASMSDGEQAARHLTPKELNALLAGLSGGSGGMPHNAVWHVELNAEQKSFVTVIIAIAVIIAAGTLIFACIWCLLDQDGLCPVACCARCLGTPRDTFSPQKWWMEALAQRIENLEAAYPLIGSKKTSAPVPGAEAAHTTGKPPITAGKPTPLVPGKPVTPTPSSVTPAAHYDPLVAPPPVAPVAPVTVIPATTPTTAPAKSRDKPK